MAERRQANARTDETLEMMRQLIETQQEQILLQQDQLLHARQEHSAHQAHQAEQVELQRQTIEAQREQAVAQTTLLQESLTAFTQRNEAPRVGTSKDFTAHGPMQFQGTEGGLVALDWISDLERIFAAAAIPDDARVSMMQLRLFGLAKAWWTIELVRVDGIVSWDEFKRRFTAQYFPETLKRQLARQFDDLVQGTDTLEKYIMRYTKLEQFSAYTLTEAQRARKFREGLHGEVQGFLASQPCTTLDDMIERSREQAAFLARDRVSRAVVAPKKPFVSPTASRGRDQRLGIQQGGSSGIQKAPVKFCNACFKEGHTRDKCRRELGLCMRCGSKDHQIRFCPRMAKGLQQGPALPPQKAVFQQAQGKGRLHVMDEVEAEASEDVVSGTKFKFKVQIPVNFYNFVIQLVV